MRKIIVIGEGKECPKCGKKMERRMHRFPPKDKNYFFTKWDFCRPCHHIQHYEEFKSSAWKEMEEQANFFNSI